MRKINFKKYQFFLTLILFLLLQLTNYFIVQNFSDIINFNDRMLFGLYGNNFFSIILSMTLIIVLLSLRKKHFFPVVFIVAGSISNIFDRLFYGGAVDYLKITNFPVFNISDILIVIGLFVLAFQLIKDENKKPLE